MTWSLVVAPSVERSLAKLPKKVAPAIVEFMSDRYSRTPIV